MAVVSVPSLHGRSAGSLNSFLTSLNLSKLVLEFIDVIGPYLVEPFYHLVIKLLFPRDVFFRP